eukprot:986148_1
MEGAVWMRQKPAISKSPQSCSRLSWRRNKWICHKLHGGSSLDEAEARDFQITAELLKVELAAEQMDMLSKIKASILENSEKLEEILKKTASDPEEVAKTKVADQPRALKQIRGIIKLLFREGKYYRKFWYAVDKSGRDAGARARSDVHFKNALVESYGEAMAQPDIVDYLKKMHWSTKELKTLIYVLWERFLSI